MFELGGEVVPDKMAHNLTRLIAEGDDAADAEMRSEVVATYLDLLQQPKLPGVLLMVRALGACTRLRGIGGRGGEEVLPVGAACECDVGATRIR